MSALEPAVETAYDSPRIYLACPLTGLSEHAKRQIGSDIQSAKHAIEAATVGDRIDQDRWPVAVYAPFDHTPPWKEDRLSPAEVYRRNLQQVHSSDALIVIAEGGGSAGVGQEIEWAVRLGLPVLFLTAGPAISRQIQGAPGFILADSYGNNASTLESKVKNFLRQWKPQILDGPRRRQARHLRFVATTERLRAAWASCPNRTSVVAQVRIDVEYLELTLSDPNLLSVMPVETLIALAHELDVDLSGHSPARAASLPVPALRALLAAAETGGWSDTDVKRLIFHGRAVLQRGDPIDLSTVAAWSEIYDRL